MSIIIITVLSRMRLFRSAGRFVLNSALLRGRNRIPRFVFLVAMTAFTVTVVKIGTCTFMPSMCGGAGGGGGDGVVMAADTRVSETIGLESLVSLNSVPSQTPPPHTELTFVMSALNNYY